MSNPPSSIDTLIETARRAAARGDIERALAVLRLLERQYPDNARVKALIRALTRTDGPIDRTTTLLPTELPPPAQALPPAPPVPAAEAREEAPAYSEPAQLSPTERFLRREIRWPAYVVAAVAVGLILLLVALRSLGLFSSVAAPAPAALTPEPTAGGAPIPTIAGSDLSPGAPATIAAGTPIAPTTVAPASPAPSPTPLPPTPTPTREPTITPLPQLAFGEVIETGTWDVTLLQANHALLLNGTIGALTPRGRFALTLLAIGNNGDVEARFPADLLTLIDEHGNRYSPVPAASTAYLTALEPGHGDLSLEEPIPPGAGNLSIPVIFDVPSDARGFQLVVDGQAAGWLVPGQ
jgi:hypothetical protein